MKTAFSVIEKFFVASDLANGHLAEATRKPPCASLPAGALAEAAMSSVDLTLPMATLLKRSGSHLAQASLLER
jgi:hypothetical protein